MKNLRVLKRWSGIFKGRNKWFNKNFLSVCLCRPQFQRDSFLLKKNKKKKQPKLLLSAMRPYWITLGPCLWFASFPEHCSLFVPARFPFILQNLTRGLWQVGPWGCSPLDGSYSPQDYNGLPFLWLQAVQESLVSQEHPAGQQVQEVPFYHNLEGLERLGAKTKKITRNILSNCL